MGALIRGRVATRAVEIRAAARNDIPTSWCQMPETATLGSVLDVTHADGCQLSRSSVLKTAVDCSRAQKAGAALGITQLSTTASIGTTTFVTE